MYDYILNLTIIPNEPIANCTDVIFTCQKFIFTKESTINSEQIWWTFQGQNVSTSVLPGSNLSVEQYHSKLSINCAQFGVHSGQYACHAPDNASSFMFFLKIYGKILKYFNFQFKFIIYCML